MLSYAGNTEDSEVYGALRSFRTVMTLTRVALSVIWVAVVMIPLSAFDAEGTGAVVVRIFLGVVGGLVLALMSWEVAEVVVANFWMKDLIREKRVLRLKYGWRLKKPDALGNSYIRANPTEQYEFEVAIRGFVEDYCRKRNLHI